MPLLGAPSPRPIRSKDTGFDGDRGRQGVIINASTSILRCIINRVNTHVLKENLHMHHVPFPVHFRRTSRREK